MEIDVLYLPIVVAPKIVVAVVMPVEGIVSLLQPRPQPRLLQLLPDFDRPAEI